MTDRLRSIRSSLRRIDPMSLSYLGLLGVPSYLSDSLQPLRPFMFFWLFALWPLVSVLLPTEGEDSTVRYETDWRWRGRFLASYALVVVNPFVVVQSMAQIVDYVVALARYRGRPPSTERYEQRTDLALPFAGTWTVANGGVEKEDSHSWSIISQRYAYDFLVTDEEGRTHDGSGTAAEEYHCFGEPVLAPADGVVVAASDGHRDSPYFQGMLDPLQRDIRGNYVTIEHAEDEYSLLAHLREGSIAVEEGERVERGQRIGRCGHSGNSTEPHLHFQLQDRPKHFAAGLPITFGEVAVDGDEREEASIREGERVEPTDAA